MDEAGVAIMRHADATARLSAAVQADADRNIDELKAAVQKWSEAREKRVLRYENHQTSHATMTVRERTGAAGTSSG
jgi:hypothetical protein